MCNELFPGLNFVILLHKCRHRDTEVMRLLDPLYPPESYEVVDAVRTRIRVPACLDENSVDDWGYPQLRDMASLWVGARVVVAITTAFSQRTSGKKRYAIDTAYGLSGSTAQDMILNRGSLQKMLSNRTVPYVNVRREFNDRLLVFIKNMLEIAKNEHIRT